MAEKPAKKSSPARALKDVVKKITPEEVVLVSKKPVPKKPRATIAKKPKVTTDDARRQAVAERVVRKIFEEIGQPEAVRVRVAVKSSVGAVGTTKPTHTIKPQPTESNDIQVVLPSNASTRVLSKAAALQRWYHKRFPHYVARGATGLAIVFLLFGGLGVAQFSVAHFPNWQDVQRAVLCEAANCVLPTTTESPMPTLPPPPNASGVPTLVELPGPAIDFIAKPPSRLEGIARIVVRAEYSASLEVFAVMRSTGKTTPLQILGNPAGSDFTYELKPELLPAGEYELRARAVAARDGKRIYATGPRFMVPQIEVRAEEEAENEEESTANTLSGSAGSFATTTAPSVPRTALAPSDEPLPNTPISIIKPTTTSAGDIPQLQLRRPEPGVTVLTLSAPEALGVELYAQRSNATEPYFLAAARKVEDGNWQHRLVHSQLPAAQYYITARIKNPSGTLTTRGQVVEVGTPVRTTTGTTTPPRPATITTTEAVDELRAGDTPPPPRTQYAAPVARVAPQSPVPTPANSDEVTDTDVVVPKVPERAVVPTAPAVNPIVKDRFEADERELNDLLKRYASAYQSGDVGLKEMIDSELTRKRVAMVEEAVEDGDTSVVANELDATIAEEFTKLKVRVETFESLLKERSGNGAAVDTDMDGLSDFDEETLYDTDPLLFDTDADGISDGVEVMRGFDPLDSVAETVLSFTSPKEFGLVRDDVLVVEAVTPVVETDVTRGQPPVQAEIRGKGLPNSYVTLFIYSSPTIVTVKTDADGSFVYQFDKELEDGSHEVYVAVTDNTGDIIAKSSAFSFVKQAEAFTVSDAEAAPVASIDEETGPSVKELYNVVLAMGVLAFGLILLIFGMVMRREPVVTEDTQAAAASN